MILITKNPEFEGPLLLEPKIFRDERGFFFEAYKRSEFKAAGIDYEFFQDNHSRSAKGVLRGFHYQLNPMAQGKLILVMRGALLDVIIDIRKGSPSYGRHMLFELSCEDRKMLWIPPGFAHGFLALEDDTECLYKCTSEYSPAHERGILYKDPDLNIRWPISEENLIVSAKDRELPPFRDAESNFVYDRTLSQKA